MQAVFGLGEHDAGARGEDLVGEVMQCEPPWPRPSSNPSIVITSMPDLRSAVLVPTLRCYPMTTPGPSATTLLPSSLLALGPEAVPAGLGDPRRGIRRRSGTARVAA